MLGWPPGNRRTGAAGPPDSGAQSATGLGERVSGRPIGAVIEWVFGGRRACEVERPWGFGTIEVTAPV